MKFLILVMPWLTSHHKAKVERLQEKLCWTLSISVSSFNWKKKMLQSSSSFLALLNQRIKNSVFQTYIFFIQSNIKAKPVTVC